MSLSFRAVSRLCYVLRRSIHDIHCINISWPTLGRSSPPAAKRPSLSKKSILREFLSGYLTAATLGAGRTEHS